MYRRRSIPGTMEINEAIASRYRDREMQRLSAAMARIESRQERVGRDSERIGTKNIRSQSGLSVYRPLASYLIGRGVKSMIYFSTDNGRFSAWNGVAWKDVTLT